MQDVRNIHVHYLKCTYDVLQHTIAEGINKRGSVTRPIGGIRISRAGLDMAGDAKREGEPYVALKSIPIEKKKLMTTHMKQAIIDDRTVPYDSRHCLQVEMRRPNRGSKMHSCGLSYIYFTGTKIEEEKKTR